MRLANSISVALILLAAATVAIAADINGKWKAQVPGRGGDAREVTFTFQVDGDKLTGTMEDGRGSTSLTDGKVTGDTISFSVETQRGKRTYSGTVSDGEIKFKREGGQSPQQFVAKRAQ